MHFKKWAQYFPVVTWILFGCVPHGRAIPIVGREAARVRAQLGTRNPRREVWCVEPISDAVMLPNCALSAHNCYSTMDPRRQALRSAGSRATQGYGAGAHCVS